MADLDTFKRELARINDWQKSNMDKLGTVEFRRCTLAHRLLTDLVRSGGGSAELRAATAARLKEIEEGKHDTDPPGVDPLAG